MVSLFIQRLPGKKGKKEVLANCRLHRGPAKGRSGFLRIPCFWFWSKLPYLNLFVVALRCDGLYSPEVVSQPQNGRFPFPPTRRKKEAAVWG